MYCANCKKELIPQHQGNIAYWACTQCHLLWFDNKESDFITLEEAEKIYATFPKAVLKKTNYSCVRCHKNMTYEHSEYRCYFCGGMLTTAKHLLNEKRTKADKISKQKYFSLPHFKTVAIMSALVLLIGVNIGIFNNLGQKTTIASQASEIDKFIRIQRVNNKQIAVFFTTNELCTTQAIIATTQPNGTIQTSMLDISTEPSLTHFILLPIPENKTMLTIRFTTKQTDVQVTDSKTIVLNEYIN